MVNRTWTLSDLRLPFEADPTELNAEVARRCGLRPGDVGDLRITRRGVDCRNRRSIDFVYTVEFSSPRKLRAPAREVTPEPDPFVPLSHGLVVLTARPVVVGSGPAGLFAALVLAIRGYQPLVLEMGPDIATRHKAVTAFLAGGPFDERANLLFGEGGAGTWSDGKLTCRSAGGAARAVLQKFVEFGAAPSILYEAVPHIGSDRLRGVAARARKALIAMGAEFRFSTQVTAVTPGNPVVLSTDNGDIAAGAVIFAPGHSLTANYEMLTAAGAKLELKPFQMGFRMEFPQAAVETWAYGEHAFDTRLPRASFALNRRDKDSGLGITTFCNCPGGIILPVPSTATSLCVNAMSNSRRDAPFANAALVCTFHGMEMGATDPIGVLAARAAIETAAFNEGGGNHRAPARTAEDYLSGAAPVLPDSTSYVRGLTPSRLKGILPPWYLKALAGILGELKTRIPGSCGPDSAIIAVESRCSSPVRVARTADSSVEGLERVWCAGEGSGWAGGIMSSALDGIKAAEALASAFAPHSSGAGV